MNLTLTPMARRAEAYQEAIAESKYISKDYEYDGEVEAWIDGISTSWGFWEGISMGDIDLTEIVEEAKTRDLTHTELQDLEWVWVNLCWEM